MSITVYISDGYSQSVLESSVQSGDEFNQIMVHYRQFIINYYVSEYQLPHVIDASHTKSTAHVNQDPKLLKLIGWRN